MTSTTNDQSLIFVSQFYRPSIPRVRTGFRRITPLEKRDQAGKKKKNKSSIHSSAFSNKTAKQQIFCSMFRPDLCTSII